MYNVPGSVGGGGVRVLRRWTRRLGGRRRCLTSPMVDEGGVSHRCLYLLGSFPCTSAALLSYIVDLLYVYSILRSTLDQCADLQAGVTKVL